MSPFFIFSVVAFDNFIMQEKHLLLKDKYVNMALSKT